VKTLGVLALLSFVGLVVLAGLAEALASLGWSIVTGVLIALGFECAKRLP
jgi:hypothetical protein